MHAKVRRPQTFAEGTRTAAKQSFFGRESELATLHAALAEAKATPRIVVVRGAGGVGKSTLARQFAWEAEEQGHAVSWVSGERIAPNPAAFLRELTPKEKGGASLGRLGRRSKVDVLVVDAFERVASLSRWLLEDALVEAGARVLIVLTTRERLDPKLSADLRVASLIREVRLQNLPLDASMAQLAARGVPASDHADILAYTAGHPLASALVADRYRERDGYRFDPAEADDIVALLAHEFLSHVPSARHADAIRAACVLRVTDEALLRAMLGESADPGSLYEWLRELSFVDSTRQGLVPHALVRDAVYREQSARNSAQLTDFAARATEELLRRIPNQAPTEGHNLACEALYACRRSRLVQDLEVDALRRTFLRRATDHDLPLVEELIERFEGAASVATFRRLHRTQPSSLFVLCDDRKLPAAVMFLVQLSKTTTEQRAGDAILERAHTLLSKLEGTPGAAGSELGCLRYWFTRSSYQAPSPELASMIVALPFIAVEFYPTMRFLMVAVDSPEQWQPRAPAHRMLRDESWLGQVGERTYGAFYTDLVGRIGEGRDRQTALFQLTREVVRGLALLSEVPPAMLPGSAPLVPEIRGVLEDPCDEAAFAETVRASLPILRRPHDLARLSLRRSALAMKSGVPLAEAFAAAIYAACDELAKNEAYRGEVAVLKRTYLEPTGKQQAVAADLGIPFGTYRHRLRRAVELLNAELWLREVRLRGA